MPTDSKHQDLMGLRIDRSAKESVESGPLWARRYIVIGIAVFLLLGLCALGYRLLAGSTPEVTVVRAAAESGGGSDPGGIVLSASGYIVAHHKINVNSKVTGRVAWIGVEKGDKVKEGQVLVRLENDEFRAQYESAKGAADAARSFYDQLRNGSRPEEIELADHNLEEAKATLANDKITLDRTTELNSQGVVARQALDDAIAKYTSDLQRTNSLEKSYALVKIGPRKEEIDRARAQLEQAQGQADYAKSQLDATVIKAPVSGTILERTAEKGELITAQFASAAEGGPQGEVVALADLNDIQVELDIAQDDFAKLSPNQKGIVTVDAFPDRKYDGVIAQISPEANRQKATVQVKVQISNPDAFLRPDMNATVKFIDNTPHESGHPATGVVVPANAVRDVNGKKAVFVAFNGEAVMRPVQVTSTRTSGVLVQGLIGGENVITEGPADLKDGQKIKVKGES